MPLADTRQVDRAAHRAIARAKARGATDVSADDILLALLAEVSRFGIAWVGDWPIDVASLDGTLEATDGSRHGAPAPAYSAEAVRIFERGAAIARQDGARTVDPVHLLAAFADEDSGVMGELRRRYAFNATEWRAALARGDFGRTAGVPQMSNGDSPLGPSTILTVDDAAAHLGVHAQTIRNYIRNGKLPAYRLAGERSIRVLREDLMALLEQVRTDEPEQDGTTT